MSLRNLVPGSAGSDSGAIGGGRLNQFSRFLRAIFDHERELWFLALSAMLIDVTLTTHGLQLGLEERNPVARTALDRFGVLGLYALKCMAVLVGLGCRPLVPDRANGVIPLALAIPSVIAVTINTVLIALVVV